LLISAVLIILIYLTPFTYDPLFPCMINFHSLGV
jgi:hypothetical protein